MCACGGASVKSIQIFIYICEKETKNGFDQFAYMEVVISYIFRYNVSLLRKNKEYSALLSLSVKHHTLHAVEYANIYLGGESIEREKNSAFS